MQILAVAVGAQLAVVMVALLAVTTAVHLAVITAVKTASVVLMAAMTVRAPADSGAVAAIEAPAEDIVATEFAVVSPVVAVAWPEHSWLPLHQELLFR